MDDVFEATRNAVRYHQKRLADEEARYSYLQDTLMRRVAAGEMNWTTYTAHLANERHRIGQIERTIIDMKAKLPPHAEYRDGVVQLHPVWEPIDPRASVDVSPAASESSVPEPAQHS